MARKVKGRIVITGYEEILEDIQKLGKETPEIITEALEAQGKETNKQYKNFIEQHRYAGVTEETLIQNPKAINEGNKIIMKTGFDINKGGIASVFLDKGTPKMKAFNFRNKIKKNPASIKAFDEVLSKQMR